MKKNITLCRAFGLGIGLLLMTVSVFAQKASELKYVNVEEFAVLLNQGYDNTAMRYSRLPQDCQDQIRKAVWDLGLNSAGLAIRFSSDSQCLGASWTLLNNFHMSHMPGTGIRGIDLYTMMEDGSWHFVGTAQPNGKESRNVFVRNMDGSHREYLAYLPLYDGVETLSIGIDSTATIAPPRVTTHQSRKPIVFYGTSITQGGCASRPGMCYTNILGRWLDCETINLGFSGNARMDFVMVDVISRVDASEYVIDCLPNCTAQIIRDSAYTFLSALAKARPDTPIHMVENPMTPDRVVNQRTAKDIVEKNAEWNAIYRRLRKEGYRNLNYIKAENFSGTDGEETVDGAHLTDMGFMRMAEALKKELKR